MPHQIVLLPIERWKGFQLPFAYTSLNYYDAEITQANGVFSANCD
jgi:hypothetical protein